MYRRKILFLSLLFVGAFVVYYQQVFKQNYFLLKNYVDNISYQKNVEEDAQIITSSKKELQLEVSNVKNKMIINSLQLVVRGKTVPKADVFVNQKELNADNNGNFSISLFLDEGENLIVIVANDENGNYVEREISVNLQTSR